jgi:hypothetical protein
VRKTLQFRPERSSRGGKPHLLKLEEQELRFSMKMVFAPYMYLRRSLSKLSHPFVSTQSKRVLIFLLTFLETGL